LKKVCILLLHSLLLASLSLAQSGPASDAPATREEVVKLFELMNVQQQTRSVIASMMQQQRVMMRDVLRKRHPEISEEQLQHADSLMDDYLRDFPVDQILADTIPVYQRHLTRSDVEAMSAFYASPTGKKLLNDMPAIMTESMQAMMPHLQESMDKMMDRIDRESQEEQKQVTKPPTEKK
jgi:hypothetical protein